MTCAKLACCCCCAVRSCLLLYMCCAYMYTCVYVLCCAYMCLAYLLVAVAVRVFMHLPASGHPCHVPAWLAPVDIKKPSMEKFTSEVKVPTGPGGGALSVFGDCITVMQHQLRLKSDNIAKHLRKDKDNRGPMCLTKDPVAQSQGGRSANKKEKKAAPKVVPKELCDLMGYRGVITRAAEARADGAGSSEKKASKASADVRHLLT